VPVVRLVLLDLSVLRVSPEHQEFEAQVDLLALLALLVPLEPLEVQDL